jgi:tyrosyl-tRNA synthetase
MFSFNKNIKVNTDEKEIDKILSRGVFEIYPNKDSLKKELMSGKRLRIYAGADATGKELHLGHAINFMLLEKLRKLGHEIIILFGDFTAQIGDPTDKTSTRIKLDKKQIDENLKNWKKQISKIINFNEKNKPKIVRNSDWLSKLSFNDVLELSSNFTVQQMIERDMFQKRIEDKKPIYLHEFFYPLMQGYDSVVLNVDLEIGGTDQTFNMLAGRTLLEKLKNKNKFVLTLELLSNPKTGKKMSKSEGEIISLLDSSKNIFGKVMAQPDEMIFPLFEKCTNLEIEEINKLKEKIQQGENPKNIKIILAKEIVTLLFSKEVAEKELINFEKTFSEKEVMLFEEFNLTQEVFLNDFLTENKIVSSKTEVQRLVFGGAIQDTETKEKINDSKFLITKNISLKVGKKHFIKILFK